MVRERNAEIGTTPEESQEIGDIECRTNIEVWLVEAAEEFERIATRPVSHVQIMSHGDDCTRLRRSIKSGHQHR